MEPIMHSHGSMLGATGVAASNTETSSRFMSLAGRATVFAVPLVALALLGLAGCKDVTIGPPEFPSCPPSCHR